MNGMTMIRILGRQLQSAGKEMLRIAEEIEQNGLTDKEDVELAEVYNTLLMHEVEKAQYAVLTLADKMFGGADEGTDPDTEESNTVSADEETKGILEEVD